MTLNQLRYFCTAARLHSISQAARSLYVTQPTISIAIRDLEKEFSTSLFIYTKNHLELTPDGERFYEKASYLLHCSEDLHQEFIEKGRFTHKIRIGIPPILSVIFFPKLIDAFHEEYPDIFLELNEYGSVRACNLVQDEVLDIGLVNMEQHNIDKFNSQVLVKDQLMCCMTPEHPLADRKSLTVMDLKDEHLIYFNGDSVQNQLLNARYENLGLTPRIILKCSQIPTTLNFVRKGDCVCFYYSRVLEEIDELVGIPLNPPIYTNIGLVWKKGKYVPEEVQRFINFCKKYYKDYK